MYQFLPLEHCIYEATACPQYIKKNIFWFTKEVIIITFSNKEVSINLSILIML